MCCLRFLELFSFLGAAAGIGSEGERIRRFVGE